MLKTNVSAQLIWTMALIALALSVSGLALFSRLAPRGGAQPVAVAVNWNSNVIITPIHE